MFCLEDSRFKIHCFTAGFACYPSTAQVERWVKDHSPTTQAEPALVSSEAAHAAPTLVSSEAAQATLPTDGGETAQASLTLVSSEEAQADPNLVSSEEAQAALPTDGGETAQAAPTADGATATGGVTAAAQQATPAGATATGVVTAAAKLATPVDGSKTRQQAAGEGMTRASSPAPVQDKGASKRNRTGAARGRRGYAVASDWVGDIGTTVTGEWAADAAAAQGSLADGSKAQQRAGEGMTRASPPALVKDKEASKRIRPADITAPHGASLCIFALSTAL